MWTLAQSGGLTVARCAQLTSIAGVGHAFSTRVADGRLDFDLGPGGAPRASSRNSPANRLAGAAGLAQGFAPVTPNQVHGSRVVGAEELRGGTSPDADAAVLFDRTGPIRSIGIRTADCVPLLLADRSGRGLAAVHAGWRGTETRIAEAAVAAMLRQGLDAQDLFAAVGPSIRPCCYPVSEEVARRIADSCGSDDVIAVDGAGRPTADLSLANRLQLQRAGLPRKNISQAPWCTGCAAGLFFSFRREGDRAGRQMACIGWGLPGASA